MFRLILDLDLLYRQFNLLPDLLIVPVNQGIDVLFRPFGVFDQVLDHTRRASQCSGDGQHLICPLCIEFAELIKDFSVGLVEDVELFVQELDLGRKCAFLLGFHFVILLLKATDR